MGNSRAQTEQAQFNALGIQLQEDDDRLTLQAPMQNDHVNNDNERVTAKNRDEESRPTRTREQSKKRTRPQHNHRQNDPRSTSLRRKRSGLFCTASSRPSLGRRLRRRLGGREACGITRLMTDSSARRPCDSTKSLVVCQWQQPSAVDPIRFTPTVASGDPCGAELH